MNIISYIVTSKVNRQIAYSDQAQALSTSANRADKSLRMYNIARGSRSCLLLLKFFYKGIYKIIYQVPHVPHGIPISVNHDIIVRIMASTDELRCGDNFSHTEPVILSISLQYLNQILLYRPIFYCFICTLYMSAAICSFPGMIPIQGTQEACTTLFWTGFGCLGSES